MDSVDKYGSCGVPWWQGKIVEPLPAQLQAEKMATILAPAVQQGAEALVPVVQRLTDALKAFAPMLDESVKNLSLLWDAMLKSYPDKRVVWLAFHHPKERVRKKNRRRIIKWISRGEQ